MEVIPLINEINRLIAVCGGVLPSGGQITELNVRCGDQSMIRTRPPSASWD